MAAIYGMKNKLASEVYRKDTAISFKRIKSVTVSCRKLLEKRLIPIIASKNTINVPYKPAKTVNTDKNSFHEFVKKSMIKLPLRTPYFSSKKK